MLVAHVIGPDATSRHLAAESGAVPVAVAVVEASGVSDGPRAGEGPGGHRHDHPQQHTVAECALGQPPQGPAVDVPCLSPLGSRGWDGAPAPTRAHHVAGRDFVVPIAHAADSTILRI
ncbi:hypothetical protein [Streptomyces sp. NPDC029674]|uniref:hypothetical protein n=1 Tax=Streptomyces sp. NPDC029674 TaxID=3365297 RepID=UPI0038513892